jgi:uncharacterized protein
MQIPIQLEVEGSMVMGMLHVPKACHKNTPVILFCYGLNGNRVDNNRMAVMLGREAERRGVILARFDYRGLGISGEDFSEIDLSTKLMDALRVLDHLEGCLQGEEASFYLLGFSDGCRIATKLLEYTSCAAGLILWSPIFYIEKSFVEDKMKKKFIRDPRSGKLVFPFKGLTMNLKHLRQQLERNGDFEAVRDYSQPKLAIFGESDPATWSIYRSLMERTPSMGDFLELVIPEADHLFSRNDCSTLVIQQTLNWIISRQSSKEREALYV